MSPFEVLFYSAMARNAIPYAVFKQWNLLLISLYDYTSLLYKELMARALLISTAGCYFEMKGSPEELLSRITISKPTLIKNSHCIFIEYPKPPQPDYTMTVPPCGVLFSAILFNSSPGSQKYYYLRYASNPNSDPHLMHTRELLSDGTNLNLGPGCYPSLDGFLQHITNLESGNKTIYGKSEKKEF